MTDAWYSLLDFIMPFEWINHGFMKNALLAILMVTPTFGLLGTMVVNHHMAFFSDSIGHAALTGVAVGVLAGLTSPTWSMVVFAVLLSIVISVIRTENANSMDSVIGVVSSTLVALGVVILSRGGGFARYSYYLVGDLLSITPSEALSLIPLLIGTLLFWGLTCNKLVVLNVNRSVARSRGIRVNLVEAVFMIAVAVIVTISIRWVGIMIINSLLVLPASAARNIAGNAGSYHAIAVILSVISGITGLILSYYWGTAAGATIVLVCALFYIATFIWKLRKG